MRSEKQAKILNENICLQRKSDLRHLALYPDALGRSASSDRYLVAFQTLTQSRHMNKINT